MAVSRRYKSHPGHSARPDGCRETFDANGYFPWETSRQTYPLTAVCTCGELITKADRLAPWSHSTFSAHREGK